MGSNKWNSESAKFRLYGECDRTVQPSSVMCSPVFKLACGLILSCCKRRLSSQCTLWDIPTLPSLFLKHWSWYQVHSSMVIIRWFEWMRWSKHSLFDGLTAVHGRTPHLSHCCCHYFYMPPTASLCYHLLFSFYRYSASINECQWVPFFQHEGIQSQTSSSYEHPHHRTFCQPVSLLLSHTTQPVLCSSCSMVETLLARQQLLLMTFLGKNKKLGGITFGATFSWFYATVTNVPKAGFHNLPTEWKTCIRNML